MGRGKKTNDDTVRLKGIGVSPGVVIGTARVMVPDHFTIPEWTIAEDQVEHEICRLETALIETRRQIRAIQSDLESKTALGDASILDAHLMVLDDRSFIEEVVTEMQTDRRNAEAVVRNAADRYAAVLGSVEDDYLRERVADIRDVARRIIRNLSGDIGKLPETTAEHVLAAHDLAPSFTATLRRDDVLGLATDLGSATSHTAVMARAMEIPAVVGLRDVSRRVADGTPVVMDGNRGIFVINPTEDDLEDYGRLAETRRTINQGLNRLHDMPAETQDGHRVALSANAEGTAEVDAVLEYGAEGIGLFRSEYLFITHGSGLGEDEQAAVYTEVADRLAPAPVIIRTIDLGGDKFLAEEAAEREANPFLGCRSIRLSLLYPEHFKRQLRGILRASAGGNVKVMYPMISNAREVIQANGLLEEAKEELAAAGVGFDADIEVGVMVEIPSAAISADIIAPHVSFLSIGTNDLIQYTLAVDRVNERVAYLYEPTHPAIVRLIKNTVEVGHANDVWVGICGEMAANPLVTPLLLGLGLDEFSVAPAAVPVVKDMIRNLRFDRAVELTNHALTCRSAAEILVLCRQLATEVSPELLELI